jgi:lipopolysaccharide/colanic/teichoic acid biosynthesis glycosyltransferase
VPRRCIDLVAAALGVALFSPAALLIAVLIRLEDGGPVLFTQTRLGERKRPFRIYKFRSMREARITRVGRWLRATGLDELPQLANVLRGDMSLVGPRPLTESDVARLGWATERHAQRWHARPGIVGLAQVYAGRGARVSRFLDQRYVRTRGLGTDLGIVLISAAMGLLGKRRVKAWLRARRDRRRSARTRHGAAPSRAAVGTPRDAFVPAALELRSES